VKLHGSILPKFDFIPKNVIYYTDGALYGLWTLAGWPGIEDRPRNVPQFSEQSAEWWKRTFNDELVNTETRRFRGAIYTDGVKCCVSVAQRIPVADRDGERHGQEPALL